MERLLARNLDKRRFWAGALSICFRHGPFAIGQPGYRHRQPVYTGPHVHDPNSSNVYPYTWSFNGTVNGNQLSGRWQNNFPDSYPHHGGPFAFSLDSSGRSFQGNCKGDYEYTWDSPVTGVRTDSGSVIPPYIPPNPNQTPYIPPNPNPVPSGCNFTGTWDTDFGDLHLTQTGNVLTGSYNWKDGRIVGTVSGNSATGTWSQSPSFQPPDDAGDFTFTLSSGCQSFSGQWRYGSCGWEGTIRGTRAGQTIPPTPPTPPNPVPPAPAPVSCAWTGTWSCDWSDALNLTQSGTSVTGSYFRPSWNCWVTLDGTVSGSTLTGIYTDPSGGTTTQGKFQFVMSADCNKFTGQTTHSLSPNSGWYNIYSTREYA